MNDFSTHTKSQTFKNKSQPDFKSANLQIPVPSIDFDPAIGSGKSWSCPNNVGDLDRMGSLALGGLLLGFGLKRFSHFSGWLLSLTGAALLLRTVSGRCYCYKALGVNTKKNDRMTFQKSIMIQKPIHEVHRVWDQFSAHRNLGAATFKELPGERGTMIEVSFLYKPFGGRFAAAITKLFRKSPDQQLRENLRRFKSLVETGEIPRNA